jgi:uncharacterized protein (TIGR03083 family)
MNTRTDTTAILQSSWAALDGVIADLDAAQWAQPSLCPGWSAHDVLVHVTSVTPRLVLCATRPARVASALVTGSYLCGLHVQFAGSDDSARKRLHRC